MEDNQFHVIHIAAVYIVYILKSATSGKRYIGYTNDITKRLERHNRGLTKTTRNLGKEWSIIYKEEFQNKKDALIREKELKKMKGGITFKNLLRRAGIV